MEHQQPARQVEIHNFDEYIQKYFPNQTKSTNPTLKNAEEIGIQMAHDSLNRIRETLVKSEVA
jgi:hypothetical protein